jgi:hypothetical protein
MARQRKTLEEIEVKLTGGEPNFKGKEISNVEMAQALNWYSQNRDNKTAIKYTNEYFKRQKIKIDLSNDFEINLPNVDGLIHCAGVNYICDYQNIKFEDFEKLVEVFLKIKGDRKNFLHAHYVLTQLLLRQGVKLPENSLNSLRTPARLREHDDIYQKCCDVLGWNFTPLA